MERSIDFARSPIELDQLLYPLFRKRIWKNLMLNQLKLLVKFELMEKYLSKTLLEFDIREVRTRY